MTNDLASNHLIERISELLENARKRVAVAVNNAMVLTYFEVGRAIVENEQNGKIRADYGKHVLERLSERLTKDFGKGFSLRNLEQMSSFILSIQKRRRCLRNHR